MKLCYENILITKLCYNGDYVFLYKTDKGYDTIRISQKELKDDYNNVQKGINLVWKNRLIYFKRFNLFINF